MDHDFDRVQTVRRARAIVVNARFGLFDFDGPICSVFAGYSAATIARQLACLAINAGVPPDAALLGTPDPHEVLRRVSAVSPEHSASIELALQAAEVTAVDSAVATPGAEVVLRTWASRGTPAVIVSNNCELAIRRYLDRAGLSALVAGVFGRDPNDVTLMKPNTHLLAIAMASLRAAPSVTIFVGDTVTDMQAATRADITGVGYANKPGKAAALAAAGADVIIREMTELADPSARG